MLRLWRRLPRLAHQHGRAFNTGLGFEALAHGPAPLDLSDKTYLVRNYQN